MSRQDIDVEESLDSLTIDDHMPAKCRDGLKRYSDSFVEAQSNPVRVLELLELAVKSVFKGEKHLNRFAVIFASLYVCLELRYDGLFWHRSETVY
jgi:hypothetical protein